MKSILGFIAGVSIVLVLALAYFETTANDAVEPPSSPQAARVPDTLRAAAVAIPAPAPTSTPPVPTPQPTPNASPSEPASPQPTYVPPPVSEPVPEGPTRTNDDIERQARSHRTRIDGCYTVALASNPRLSGTIGARITISTSGRVTAVKITTDSVNDPNFAYCIEDEIGSWQFGPSAAEYTGTYRFTFAR